MERKRDQFAGECKTDRLMDEEVGFTFEVARELETGQSLLSRWIVL